MEPVVLYGRGAHMDMQVEGRAARSKDPLMFEIQPHHLSDCHNPKRLTHKLFTTLTVKRSFTVINSGEVAFTIVNMSLNNIPCENRGFKILNCRPFTLAPNETHIVDIVTHLSTSESVELRIRSRELYISVIVGIVLS
uniref:Transmembrane protein 131-like conserved domain-containing protein n=1 Tax=Parascaris equorum TaxID=6256 RepID=A0A914REY1_PAREQ